jgi:hypothetical protein
MWRAIGISGRHEAAQLSLIAYFFGVPDCEVQRLGMPTMSLR